jgi:hypothetical protein
MHTVNYILHAPYMSPVPNPTKPQHNNKPSTLTSPQLQIPHSRNSGLTLDLPTR